ncbi:MAG: hypothetical protein WBQ75_19820 [Acetobacteraceae bacterium]
MSTRARLFAALLLAGLAIAPAANGDEVGVAASGTVADPATGAILLDIAGATTKFAVGPGLVTKLADARKGDVIVVHEDGTTVTAVDSITRHVSGWYRFLALGIALLCLLGAAAIATQGRPQRFMIGVDNRYSNSQSQLVLWFGAVAIVYAATVALRIVVLGWDYIGGVDMPTNLIALTGLSAFSFGGAKVVTVAKVNAAATQYPTVRAKPSAPAPRLMADLVQNDNGQADLGDFQMILVTLVAVAIFLVTAFHFLGALELATPTTILPDVDTGLLASFGIGQGAYLVKKAAGNLGD